MMAEIGLIVIALGWFYQVKSISKKKREVNSLFLGAYGIGVSLLIVDGLANQLTTLAALNGLTLMAAIAAWWKIKHN